MSKNKENIPQIQSQRQNGSLRPPAKHLPSDDFFTDSLLDATRLSSRIPSPSPQKQSLSKPRRARNTRNAQHSNHRSTASENISVRPRNKSLQPTTPLRNGASTSRLRTNSLTTPPGLNDDLPLVSPYSIISSPPPQDITDAYRQIEDEEDLAQTERELSSDESNPSEVDGAHAVRLNHRSLSESPLKPSLIFNLSPRASITTRSIGSVDRSRWLPGRTETLSEASGLSFLKEMTDQDLAMKLTPHVSQTAKDRERLRQVWEGKGPVAFSMARAPPSQTSPKGVSSIPISKVTAFSKAVRPPPNGYLNGERFHDDEHRSVSQQSDSPTSTWPIGDLPHKTLPTNTRVERNFSFSNNHGFPTHRSALTEKNLEQQNRGAPKIHRSPQLPPSSDPGLSSNRSMNDARVIGSGSQLASTQASRLPQLRRLPQFEKRPAAEGPSEIDWAAAAAEVPIPSIETSLNSERKDSTLTSTSRGHSPGKGRRWENDFTGQSFQVSESPPVRLKSELREQHRDKEIEGVAKQAVTTNRLSEIRERQSLENLRSISKSPRSRSTSRISEPDIHPTPIKQDQSELVGEPVPDTPVVILRPSPKDGSDNTPGPLSSKRPSVDRSKSHDHLQRLARAMSTTPKSSPASANSFKEVQEKIPLSTVEQEGGADFIKQSQSDPTLPVQNPAPAAPPPVVQTPKVVGAWTDTILPDTVKPIKQHDKRKTYAETPHVSTGGWVETPAPLEQRKILGNIPTIIEEVPEELTAGIVKDSSSSDTIKIEIQPDTKATIPQDQPFVGEQPKSALASILDKQKSRLVSQDITDAPREDTLNLGHDTIESLQDLLALDENDITTLSRLSLAEDDTKPLGEIQAEAELIQRLGIKIGRLQSHLHYAQKGISRLEDKVSIPIEQTITTTPQQLLSEITCTVCNEQTFQPHNHPAWASKYFPHASLPLSLPIPILFYPRGRDQWLPRPTPVGTITIAVGLWYLVESFMCELYCRPVYTDFYVWPSEPEPEFPFVLPTMLTRWTRINNHALGSLIIWLWGLATGLARAIWRVFAMSIGWSDGFVADSNVAPNVLLTKVIETATSIAVSAATGIDLSMNDDEYI